MAEERSPRQRVRPLLPRTLRWAEDAIELRHVSPPSHRRVNNTEPIACPLFPDPGRLAKPGAWGQGLEDHGNPECGTCGHPWRTRRRQCRVVFAVRRGIVTTPTTNMSNRQASQPEERARRHPR